ncbi:VCBS repeat-containing protein [Telmatocola sphagniphila]|uniref:VCBS repeat-containing protein n=1 Tax=Telmatocola sphagniphila TaxID=1123043 RepID=A0A8E6B8T7_9BACT|nr:VCBS repeat-containing protein [Telmatocola sphagniphila]QVL34260.1 VCBS repeat-containing protein [Telmatocola sphagniphila]
MITTLRLWPNVTNTASRRSPHTHARLNLETLESRDVPAAITDNGIAIATYNGQVDSTANLYDALTTAERIPTVTPFPGYRGALVTAAGDVNGDGVTDLIVAAQNSSGHVKVFDGKTGALLQSFLAFPGFMGTVNLGTADVNGDGDQDILISANGCNGAVKAISGQNGSTLASFLAFPGFLGNVSVSGANFAGGADDQIIVGAGGVGINGRVAIFNANGTVYNPGFFAFPGFNGAISVAGGDVNGDGISDIVVGAGPGAPGGAVKAFSGKDFSTIDSFLPYVSTVTNGVNVRVADGNADGVRDIFVWLQGGGYASLVGFNGKTGQLLAQGGGGEGTNSGGDSGSSGDSGGGS